MPEVKFTTIASQIAAGKVWPCPDKEPFCNSLSPTECMGCTLPAGHGGVHAAHGPLTKEREQPVFSVWRDDP